MNEDGRKQWKASRILTACAKTSAFNLACYLKLWGGVLLLSWSPLVQALQSTSLAIGKIAAADWELHDVLLALDDIEQDRQQWSLQAGTLQLPAPLDIVSGLKIYCRQFQWRDGFAQCSQGRGWVESASLQTPEFDFSFQVQDSQGTIEIDNLLVLGGRVSVSAKENDGVWQVQVKSQRISLKDLHALIDAPALQSLSGKADFDLTLKGRKNELKQVFVNTLLSHLSVQVGSKVASENATLAMELSASKNKQTWRWQNDLRFFQGGLYIEPVYLEAPKQQAIVLSGQGAWRQDSGAVVLEAGTLLHPGIGELEAVASLNVKQDRWLEQAELKARIPEMNTAAPVYLTPFLEAGPFESITLAGQMDIGLTLQQGTIDDLLLAFNGLTVDDPEQRFQLSDATGRVNWRPKQAETSYLAWQGLKVKTIPIGPGHIDFISEAKRFALQKQTDIPLLGGKLGIKEFSYAAVENDDADVHFSGVLRKLSLEQLSEALGWTPLSGEISGQIPAVTYRDKKLELGGKLTMQVFDGEVTISKLASSGMFTDFAQFYADIDLDNLDLNALTRKFQFGSIEGRLSGFAHNLYLENWRPVTFYAWFGTPEDDDSRHRISQKAVENIASIGGGGAADVISKGFMRFFDTFGYDKLGFGCYLQNGVCQMMGVDAAENGYYLIKGGGLPRIDVIGYNPRLDWNVLLQRLSRITATEKAVVE